MTIAPQLIAADAYADHWGVTHFASLGQCSEAELLSHAIILAGYPQGLIDARPLIDWPMKAARPACTPLECCRMTRVFGIQPRTWQSHVAETLSTSIRVGETEAA